ncbi:transposase [Xenorhabdus hominickii]|uniref:Transposase n=1 Tax=Xenorhabdus hominickii TaxID=351679 RepID=A0ABM6DPG1_XENHO|nr:transposase [Xenorhabdus hominickii]
MLTDGQGLPLAIAVAPANIHDIRLVIATLDGLQTGGWGYGTQLHLDKAYEAEWLEKELKTRGYVPCVHSRKEEQDALAEQDDFKVNRWVVERTHSWLNRFRRILVRWEKRIENYEAMLHLACSLIAWNIILLG